MIETDLRFLRIESEDVRSDTDSVPIIVSQLESELSKVNKGETVGGVGLAAIQIGIPKRVAIVRLPGTSVDLWNPKIVEVYGEQVLFPEGCLSLPGLCKTVARRKGVIVKNGDGRTLSFEGFDAIVVQHEIDHMNGVVIVDREYRAVQVGRNDPCPCGAEKDGKFVKFKKCHLGNENDLQQVMLQRGNS